MNKSIIFLCLIWLILCKGPYKIENGVLALNEITFGYAIREFKYFVVLFYDPECPNCQKFMPEYEKTASILGKENYVLSKIDCIKIKKICDKYEIKSFPTVALLKKKDHIVYNGERKAQEIEKWLNENTKPTFKKITSKKELEESKKNIRSFLIYFGNDEKVINELIVAERKIDDIPIFTCDSENLRKENVNIEKNETLVIFKIFDDKKNVFQDNITANNIIKFVDLYSYPKVIEFSKDTSHIIFSKRTPALIIFSLKTEKYYEEHLKLLNDIWPELGGKIKLFVANVKNPITRSLAEYCDIKNIPKVYIMSVENEYPSKYLLSGDINKDNILSFIDKWEKGKLKPYLRSEELPKNNNGDLFILVGNNFKEEVLENEKDVLIYFVSPWCKICKEFEPKLGELAKKLKPHNTKLLIAKMDATMNEVEGYQIHKFPTIKFYPGNAKNKEPLDCFTRRNITELYNFIKKNAFNKIIEKDDNKTIENTDL